MIRRWLALRWHVERATFAQWMRRYGWLLERDAMDRIAVWRRRR